MKGWRGLLAAAFVLYLGAVLQQAIAPRVELLGCRPDFLLAGLGSIALFSTTRGAIVAGFATGVLAGGLAGANMTQYICSRCLAGLFVAGIEQFGVRASPGLAFVAVAGATAAAHLLMLLLAPSGALVPYLGATIGSAVYTGAITVPVFVLLRRCFKPVSAGI